MMKVLLFILGIAVQLALCDPVDFTKTSQEWFDLRFLDSDTAILLTRGGLVFRTTTLGTSWEPLNDKLFYSTDFNNQPEYLYPSTTDPNKIYIRGRGQVCWISNDKGETWRTVFQGRILVNLDWHPVNSEWAIATDENSALYATRDFGMTWQKISNFALNYAWGDSGIGGVPESRIYLVGQSTDFVDFQYTDDWGSTFVTVQSRGFDFVFLDKQLLVAVALASQMKAVLKVTTEIGVPLKNFYEAYFPFGQDLENYGYSILDDSTGAVYLGVDHNFSPASNWGNLYVSDSSGSQYSVSLQYVHQTGGVFDFTRVKGMEGVYLANIVTDITIDNPPIVSLFTFDNGATWQRIAPPHFDSFNQSITCVGACSLHVHGWSSAYPTEEYASFGPFYTNANGVGLILANGNVGTSLEYDESKVNTYMSRDGGLTWVELRKGPSYFRFGDHGGVVVMSDSSTYSNTVYYSLDEGTSPIKQAYFPGDSVKPYRILSEKSATELKFVMLGSTQSGTYDMLVGMDFKDSFGRECDINDYYQWTPSNGLEDCILGRRITYLRRNTSRICYNTDTVEHIINQRNCECTEDDWECDVGYSRGTGSYCELTGSPLIEPPLYCPEGYNYTKTKGYRKEAGNTCYGGVDHSPDGPYPCPKSSKKGHPWVAAIVFVLVVVVIIIVGFILMKSERVREHVPFLKFLHEKTAYFKLSQQPDTVEDREKLYIPTEEEDDTPLQVRDKEEKSEEKEEEKKEEPKKQDSQLLSMEDDFNPRA